MNLSIALARSLVQTLPEPSQGLFNPWRERCVMDTPENGPEQRLWRLAQHLDCDPQVILVGEAPGYQGCRYSGVAFSSERLLLEGALPRIDRATSRLTTRLRPFSEPSATIVWKALFRLGLAERTILWNALQLHPVGRAGPLSNRTPSSAELALGAAALCLLRATFPQALMIAVGRKAEAAMAGVAIAAAAVIRHPANGGATAFSEGLANAVN
jgi:hypothetical protein